MDADKVGYLFGLSWVMETPYRAAAFAILISFGLVVSLRILQGQLIGPYFVTLLIGDTLGLPLLLAAYSVSSQRLTEDWDKFLGGFTSWWLYHAVVLIISYGVSIGLEVAAVKAGTFTIHDERKPSKAVHTFLSLPILLYLILAGLPAFIYTLVQGDLGWAISCIGIYGIAVWITTMWFDGTYPPIDPSKAI